MAMGAAIEELALWIGPMLLVAARLGGLAVYTPVLASEIVPGRVRVILVFALAAAAAPLVIERGSVAAVSSLDLWTLAPLMALEAAIGLVVGFIAMIPITSMQAGALVMGQQMGLGFARFYNPGFGDEADVLENVMFVLALGTFLALGGLDAVVIGVLHSYDYVGAGMFRPDMTLVGIIAGVLMVSLEFALRIAAPLLAIVFLETVAMGFVSKTIPQLNILSLGFPIRIMVGLGVVIVGLGVIHEVFVDHVGDVLDRIHLVYATGGGSDG